MNCCVECFKDSHIKNTINNYEVIGNCDFCASKNIPVFGLEEIPNPISDMIMGVVQIYVTSDSTHAKPLKEALRDEWDIFNAGAELIQALTRQFCMPVLPENADIFFRNVAIPQLEDMDFLREFGVVRGQSWHDFSESIKHGNRFHNNIFNPDAFASFLSVVVKTHPVGSSKFRARISQDKNGFAISDDMKAPPISKRSAGRINPEGVAVLYLSSNCETALKEVRATAFDYVTIGEFKSLRDLKVVNLSDISRTSPFLYSIELEKYAANRKVFQEIAHELAKPLRRSDSPLEYLPTQYISEFIKSQGYDGVEYASTLNPGGSNLAIFDETALECVNLTTVEVEEISYKTVPEI